MPDVSIDSDLATINSVNFTQQGSDPAAPAASHWQLFFKSGGLYARKSDGTVIGPFGTGASNTLRISEVDGVPEYDVTLLEFPNGTVTQPVAGVARYTPVGLTVAEIDGAPSGSPSTLQFPNGTLSDQGGGVYRYTPPAGGTAPMLYIPLMVQNWWTASVGTWAWTVDTNQRAGGYLKNTTNADGDEVRFPCVIPAGTWTVDIAYVGYTTRGLIDVYLGATKIGTYDNYNNGVGWNLKATIAGGVLAAQASYLGLKVNGKQGAAGGYEATPSFIALTQTA